MKDKQTMRGIAIALGMLASVIGVLSAISDFSTVGSDPAYSYRLWAGWASLVLAILAGVATIFMILGPRTASLIMLISGMLGFICINLFYIDTFYMLAVPLWFIATLLAWISTTPSTSKAMREEG